VSSKGNGRGGYFDELILAEIISRDSRAQAVCAPLAPFARHRGVNPGDEVGWTEQWVQRVRPAIRKM